MGLFLLTEGPPYGMVEVPIKANPSKGGDAKPQAYVAGVKPRLEIPAPSASGAKKGEGRHSPADE